MKLLPLICPAQSGDVTYQRLFTRYCLTANINGSSTRMIMKKDTVLNILLVSICFAAVMGCSLFSGSKNTSAVSNAESPSNANVETNTGEPETAGGQSSAEAETLVADLYKQHDSKKSPFFQTADRSRVDKYFTKTTADLIWKDANTSKGEIGAIDFDPLYDAQDVEKKNFAVGKATLNGDTATIAATYANYGEKKRITFVMKNVGGKWKIDDIRYDAGHSLLALLKETYPTTSTNAPPVRNVTNEFEGTYRVGDTTCTVRPVKMAYEIRWAKGKGSEYFFFKDANTFESEEDKSGGRNEMRFDDENFNTGTFYRADGKTFPISRAK